MPPLWVYCGGDPRGLYFRERSSIGCNKLLKTASSVEWPACGEQRWALQLISVSLEKVRGWMSAENQREITRLTMYHPRYIELSLCGDGALIKSVIVLGWKTVWVLCMTNLSPALFYSISSDFMSLTFLLHSVTLSWTDNLKDFLKAFAKAHVQENKQKKETIYLFQCIIYAKNGFLTNSSPHSNSSLERSLFTHNIEESVEFLMGNIW
jgi:hypothetical protein